jgi:hypothetical protein
MEGIQVSESGEDPERGTPSTMSGKRTFGGLYRGVLYQLTHTSKPSKWLMMRSSKMMSDTLQRREFVKRSYGHSQ